MFFLSLSVPNALKRVFFQGCGKSDDLLVKVVKMSRYFQPHDCGTVCAERMCGRETVQTMCTGPAGAAKVFLFVELFSRNRS